jgi:hypothetical protein
VEKFGIERKEEGCYGCECLFDSLFLLSVMILE